MLCQVHAIGYRLPGDSGAPVFKITNSPNTNDVELVGIMFGGIVGEGTEQDIIGYSPIRQVYSELGGSYNIWKACDPEAFIC